MTNGVQSFLKFGFRDQAFCYTDGESVAWHDGERYTPETFSYGALSFDGKLTKTEQTITMARFVPVSKLFRLSQTEGRVSVELWEKPFTGYSGSIVKLFSGFVLNCRITEESSEFTCEPITSRMSRPGLLRHYQRPCPHVLYGSLCRASENKQTVSVHAVGERDMVIASPSGTEDAEMFSGGLMFYENRTFGIVESVFEGAQRLRVSFNTNLGMDKSVSEVQILRGCNHTEVACSSWHSNSQNFGGMIGIPDNNPIGKTGVFF